jgi:chromosome segregation ATPase
MINMPVLMSFVDDNLRDAIFLNKELSKLDESVKQQIVILKQKISTMKTELKKSKSEFTSFKKHAKDECSNLSKKEKKECNEKFKKEIDEMNINLQELNSKINKIEEELYKLNESKDTNKHDLSNLKLRLKEIKKSLIQEYMLYKKCAHLKYTSISKPKSYKKAKTLSIKRSKNKYSTRKIKSI